MFINALGLVICIYRAAIYTKSATSENKIDLFIRARGERILQFVFHVNSFRFYCVSPVVQE